jgi:hypothetical protein
MNQNDVKPIRLQSLEIRRAHSWENARAGSLIGKAEFAGGFGETRLTLTDDLCRRVLGIVAEDLVAGSRELAHMMTNDVIEASGLALEAPAEPEILDEEGGDHVEA